MTDFHERLESFLVSRNRTGAICHLTPDASTREYFRIEDSEKTAVACIYPEPFVAAEQSYIDVTSLFLNCGLPVAKILDYDEALGIILLEDLGNRILRDDISEAAPQRREALIDEAITLIAGIQAATKAAFESGSIASRLFFDTEKLSWELEFFKTHYFTTLRGSSLSPTITERLTSEFLEISRELEKRASVLCHRDFHAANIMIDSTGALRIIDHQDARIGSPAYDLVSLLLDRITEPPAPEWLARKRRLFLERREQIGLERLDEEAFAEEFRLQTIQRCLKAAGTFSYQSAKRGKTYFTPFIKPMFRIVLRAAENLDRFPVLRFVLRNELGAD